jgi:restriction system protein
MAHGKRKQNVTLLDELMDAPWLLIFVVGVVVFIVLVGILPDLAPHNIILNSIFHGVAAVAWVVFAIFFLFCVVFYAMSASSGSKRPALKAVGGDTGGGSAYKPCPPEPPTTVPQVPPETAVAASPPVEPNPEVERDEPEQAPDIHDTGSEHAAEIKAKPTAWSIDVIRAVEWKRFEDLCQKFYETSGIRSETTALGPDGGMDILLHQDDTGKPTAIVQCRAWGEDLVGVRPIRELLGVMTHEKIGRAFFMTSGHFADDAKVLASSNRITLIDGDMLLIMIRRLPAAAQKGLLEFATEGDYMTPTCPSCGIKMKHASGKSGNPDFWACHNHPRCRQKFAMRQEASQQVLNH